MFIRGAKLKISLGFIWQLYLKVPKDVRLISTHFFNMKISNKRELQQIALNHWSDINNKDFLMIHKNALLSHILFLVNDTTLASDNPWRFTKNIFII